MTTDAKRTFILERTLPDGRVKRHDATTRRNAAQAAFYCLWDNGVTNAKSAERIATELERSPADTEVRIGGYAFRLVES